MGYAKLGAEIAKGASQVGHVSPNCFKTMPIGGGFKGNPKNYKNGGPKDCAFGLQAVAALGHNSALAFNLFGVGALIAKEIELK